jgi:chromosome segregation ATPase
MPLQAYRDAVAELKGANEECNERIAELESVLDAANKHIVSLNEQLASGRTAQEEAAAVISSKEAQLRELDRRLTEAALRSQAELKAADERALRLERTIREQQADMAALKDQTRVRALEEQLAAAGEALAGLTAERDEAARLLAAHNEQLELNLRDIHELEENRETHVAVAVRGERRRLEDAARQIEALQVGSFVGSVFLYKYYS